MCRLATAPGMAKIRLSFFVSVSRAVRPPGVVSIAFSTPEFSPADSTLRGFLLYRLCLIIVVMEKSFILQRELGYIFSPSARLALSGWRANSHSQHCSAVDLITTGVAFSQFWPFSRNNP